MAEKGQSRPERHVRLSASGVATIISARARLKSYGRTATYA
jgi:hypothetical protein